MGHASIYPTGVTIYKPEKCFNGYTLFPAKGQGALLIDMNGKAVHLWKDLQGFPNKLLPGGIVIGSTGERDKQFSHQDMLDLVQVDWDGNIQWSFQQHEYTEDEGYEPRWIARQHHDYQRTGNPVGYYVPGMECKTDSGNTLVLAHRNANKPRITGYTLLDDCIYELDWEGNKIWEWNAIDHFNELGLTEIEKNALCRNPNLRDCGLGDWAHINSMSVIGPNKWYDNGDERFHPDNIIMDSRDLNIIFIINKETGKIVWQLGSDFSSTRELRAIGQIIGQHHAHIIPKGLPGEGNLLVFDNGGFAGYWLPGPTTKEGLKAHKRDFSRVLEINPITLEIVWQYTPTQAKLTRPMQAHYFYSPLVSSAQRLPNGNTFITEGCSGRFIEVTAECETVWEYISPYKDAKSNMNMVYRAYRYPYEYVPQLDKPEELAVESIDNSDFRLPNAASKEIVESVSVSGTKGYEISSGFCVTEEK